MTDWYADYYRQSRGYNDNDLRELRNAPRRPSTQVPDVFKHRFADPAEYDAWVEERRRAYFD
jgi:hypothetical protein